MYVKVFPSMYDGTLATQGPWEALVTFQQMLVLADPLGIVDMTPGAIAARTTIPLDIIRIGVAALEKPDPESRSAELEGRRIVRLADSRSWGWQIVNYLEYRAIRDEPERREYMRGYRRLRRASGKDVNKVNKSEHVHNVHSVHRSSPKQKQNQKQKQKQKQITPQEQPPNSPRRSASPPTLPDWLPPELWISWREDRKARRSAMTVDAERLSLQTLTRLREEGHDPKAVIEQSIERRWIGLFPIKQGGQHHGKAGSKDAERQRVMDGLSGKRKGRVIEPDDD
jgi:hypothetical protein